MKQLILPLLISLITPHFASANTLDLKSQVSAKIQENLPFVCFKIDYNNGPNVALLMGILNHQDSIDYTMKVSRNLNPNGNPETAQIHVRVKALSYDRAIEKTVQLVTKMATSEKAGSLFPFTRTEIDTDAAECSKFNINNTDF